MMQEYKYKANYGTWHWSIIHILGFVAAAVAVLYIYDGGYMPAWIISFIIALVGLMVLSIPRKIVLTDTCVEICCVSDRTSIAYKDIASVRTVAKSEVRWFVPIFAAMGFMGFYGYFINLRRLDLVTVYALKWDDFVEITDIFDDKYYVSCDRREELVAAIASRITLPDNGNDEQQ